MEVDDLAGIYKEIAYAIDVNTAVELHKLFNGQQIVFPKKLYNKEYIYTYIKENYNGKNLRELSRILNYSDRRIRQIISEKTIISIKEETENGKEKSKFKANNE